MYCNDHFDIWWDPERYNWSIYLNLLIEYCLDYIDVWWDLDKIKENSKNSDIMEIFDNEKIPTKYKLQLKLLLNINRG
jgi:hypothetical protein